jgi:nuclear pore complex protein Nup98-Nup96
MPGMARPQGQPLTAAIDRNPYGVNPLFTPSKATTETPAAQTDPAIISVKTAEKKKPVLTPHFKVTPRSTSKVKLRGFAGTSPVAGQGLSEPKSALKIQPTIVKEQKVIGLDSRFTPRKTMTKLIISETPETSMPSSLSQKKGLRSGVKEVTFDPLLEDVALSSMKEKEILLQKSQDISRSELSTPSKTVHASSLAASLTSPQGLPAKETDYMIEPPLTDLLLQSDEELKAVSGFKVSLEGVGWVKFLRPVDLLQASPTGTRSGIEQIPGCVVILEPKVCTVYPDEDVKPPCGFGLNVPAEINIEKCWPLDKSSKKPILDESDPRHDRHMQKLERMPGTKWLGFHNPSGTWRFRVEHFSRYGLIDDDSDDEIDDDRLVPQEMEMVETTTIEQVDEEDESIAKDSFAYIKRRERLDDSYSEEESELSNSVEVNMSEEDSEDHILIESSLDQSEEEGMEENDGSVDVSFDYIDSPSKESIPKQKFAESLPSKQDLASAFSTNISNVIQQRDMARKVQTMKSTLFSAFREKKQENVVVENSLFGSEPLGFQLNEELPDKKREKLDSSPDRKEMDTRSNFELIMKNESLLSSPKKYRKSFTLNPASKVANLKQSVLNGNEKQIVDASFFMSRSFRVGWAGKVFVKIRYYTRYIDLKCRRILKTRNH